MPFTFSHPAAIIPFRLLPKRLTSLTGLVIGSMCPDFEYFLRMRGDSTFSHEWFGLLWFNLPLSVVLAFIYHFMVRDGLIDNLPLFLKKRLISFKSFDWVSYFKKNYWVVIISVIIGGCTHIVWDGFTHKHGLFVTKNGWFDQAFIINGYIMPRYKMLQHFSTVIGGLFIAYTLLRLPEDESIIKQKSILPYWFSVVLITIGVTITRMLFLTAPEQKRFDIVIVTVVAGWLIGLLLTPSLLSLKNRAAGKNILT